MANHPDLRKRPAELRVEKSISATAIDIYRAWTEEIDQWFAAPGTLTACVEVNGLYFFETHFDEGRHAHYGRYLILEPPKLIEQTWVTGDPGTKGAETVVRVELIDAVGATNVSLTHKGFYDIATMQGHREAWPVVLDLLEAYVSGNKS